MINKKYPFVHQRENKDCGVACLSMIIKYYNGCISEDTLYDMTNTDKKGTSAYNLIKTANSIGFKSEGIRCDIEKTKDVKCPFIAHVLLDGKYGHYVVVYEINWKKKEMYIGDPARKKLKMSIQEFKKIRETLIFYFLSYRIRFHLLLYKQTVFEIFLVFHLSLLFFCLFL